jgi:hypothetical protein
MTDVDGVYDVIRFRARKYGGNGSLHNYSIPSGDRQLQYIPEAIMFRDSML